MIENEIDALLPGSWGTPLWVVYGGVAFPSILCCRINAPQGKPVIWGYSIYRRSPGFRTLGQDLAEWMGRQEDPHFFADQNHALAYLKKITWPRCK